MTKLLPIVLALWASAISAGTYGWLVAPAPSVEAAASERDRDTASLTIAVPGGEGTHYLSLKIAYETEPDFSREVPIEAAIKDLLIAAAHRSPLFAHPDRWRAVVAQELGEAKPRLGVKDLHLVRGGATARALTARQPPLLPLASSRS